MAGELFLSHASRDADLATTICRAFEAAGTACWVAPRDIPEGADWAAEIVSAIEASQALLLLLTERSNASRQVGREVACADSRGVPIVPVRLSEVRLSGRLEFYLGDEQWIDALARPLEPILDDFVARVRARMAVVTRPAPVEEVSTWTPPRERVLADLSADLTRYRDLAYRMQAAMSESARVLAQRAEANQIFIEAIVEYNEFGRGFMKRLPAHEAAIGKYWGQRMRAAFGDLHTFLEGQVYRGRMFELNDVRVRINDLGFGDPRAEEDYAEADRRNAPALAAARGSLAALSDRMDCFLTQLAEAT